NDERQLHSFPVIGVVAGGNVRQPVLRGVVFKVQIDFVYRNAFGSEPKPRRLFVELQRFFEPPLIKSGDNIVLVSAGYRRGTGGAAGT
ncbi:hypothetical protein DCD75_18580, partial [Acinetobacter baumannii]